MSLVFKASNDMASAELELAFKDRACTVIFGPSGSGKTSLLRAIAGLPSPLAVTELTVNGANIRHLAPHQRPIVLSAQNAALFPHLDVQQNLVYGLKRRYEYTPDIQKVVERLGLSTLLKRKPASLSGGEAQRVALGRALLSNPLWLLLDEPLTNLDQNARKDIVRFLNDWRKQRQIGVIYVTHDIPEALAIADQVITLAKGKLLKSGDPDVLLGYQDPQQELSTVVSARLSQHHKQDKLSELLLDGNRLLIPEITTVDGTKTLYLQIAAKDVSLALQRPQRTSILNLLPCTVSKIEISREASATITLNLGSQHLLAKVTRRSVRELDLQVGQKVWAQVKGISLQT